MLNVKTKQIIGIVAGTSLEFYDSVLYLHFLIILSPLFFPNSDPNSNILLGFSSFALGYLARPLGGIIFGHIGDRFGRKKAIASSIIFTTLATFSIGLLPTCAQIGIIAPMLLILCRFVQSLSVGGEVPGASCFLIENSDKTNRCLRSSYINVSYMLGGIIAAFLGFIFTQTFVPSWAWRIPFLMTILFGSLGYYIRYKLKESPEFQTIIQKQQILKVPLLEVIKKDRAQLLCTLGICAGVMAPSSILYAYLPHLIKDILQISVSHILAINCFVMFFTAMCLLGMGKLADRIGPRKVMAWNALIFIFSIYPLFTIIQEAQTILSILIVELIISFLWAGITAPLNVLTSLMYFTQRRYTGIAFGWGIGSIIFAGFSPMISKSLVTFTGNESSPAFFLSLCVFSLLFAVIYAPDVSKEQDHPFEFLQKKWFFGFNKGIDI